MKRKKLIFKKDYGRDLLERKKQTTIRLYSPLKKGDEVEIIAGSVRLGTAKIVDVEVKKLKELTDEDARADGFESREKLIRELRKIYGRKISESSEVKIIRFKFLGD